MNNYQKKIYIIDDDDDILNVIQIILRMRDHNVVVSKTGDELFTLDEDELPDLILLDVWIAGIDGRDLCRAIKQNERTRNIPALFISANANIKKITEECLADGYIEKPFEMKYLIDQVQMIGSV